MENGVYAADAAPKRPARPQSAHPSRRPQRPASAGARAGAVVVCTRPLAAHRGAAVLRFVVARARHARHEDALAALRRQAAVRPLLMLSRASAEERVQLHLEVRYNHQLDTEEPSGAMKPHTGRRCRRFSPTSTPPS